MTDVINFTKTAFTWTVVALTVLWSVGLASLVAPAAANAAECPTLEAGDFVRSTVAPDVYVLDEDMALHYMDNGMVAASWPQYSSSAVNYVETECLGAYTFATSQPGVGYAMGLVKQPISPAVYYVALDGTLYNVPSEAVASALFGANWATLVRDVVPAFAINYGGFNDVAGDLSTDMLPENALVSYDGAYWVHMDGAVYPVDGTLPQYHMDRALQATAEMLDGVEIMEDSVTALESLDILRNTDAGDSEGGSEGGSEGEVEGDGELRVSPAAATPESAEVPANAIGVVFTSVNLANTGDTDVDVTGITIQRTGLGNYLEFDRVYVEVDGVRHGSKRTLGSDNEVELFFSTAQSMITVAAGETVQLDLVADMDGDYTGTYGTHRLRATAFEVEDGTELSGTLPVSGNQMARSDAEVSEVVFEYETVNDEVEVGEDGETVAEFNLDPQSDDDVELRRIVLENTGTADAEDASNFELYRGSTMVAGPVELEDDMLYFELDTPFFFEEGDDYSFEVRADIEGGAGSKLRFELDETTDAHLYEVLNGFRASVSSTGTAELVTITAGDLTINEADDNPASQSVSTGSEDVLLLAAEISAEAQPLVITELVLDITASGDEEDLENVTLKLGTRTVGGPDDAAGATLTFDEEFEVSGVQTLYVYADIADTASPGDTFVVEIDNANVTAEELDGDAIEASDISGSANGNTFTVDTGELSVSEDVTYGDESVVAGASEALIGQYVLRAPSSEGIELETVGVYLGYDANGASEVDEDTFSGLRVSIDTEEKNNPDSVDLAGDSNNVTSTSALNEFSVDTEIAADEAITLSIYADIESNTTFGAGDYVHTAVQFTYRGMISDERIVQDEDDAVSGQEIQLATGALTVEAKSDPEADIVIADGSTEVFVGEFEFEADNDDYVITDLDIEVSSTPAGVKALRITNNKNSNTKTVTTQNANNLMLFNNLSIPVNDGESNTRVKLYAVFNDVESAAVDSGDSVLFDLRLVEADPAAAGDTLEITGSGDYVTEEFVLRATRPTVVATAGDSAYSINKLRSGDVEMMDITITADEAGDVVLGAFILNITGTTSAVTELQLWDDSEEVLATTTIVSGANDFNVSAIEEEISAGSSKSYTLVLVTAGIVDGDELIMKLNDFEWVDDDEDDTTADGTYVTDVPSKTFTADRDS